MWKTKMMSVFLAGTMAFSSGVVVYADEIQEEENVAVELTDIENHWAKAEIEKMVEYNIISGYPDSTFRPNESVTQIQAVSMVMKLLKQVSDDLVTVGDDYIGEVPSWAKESVELALYNNIVSWEEIQQYDQPASRMFVVNLLVNGLGADSNTVNESNLSFSDITELSSAEKTNLSIALQNSLVAGFGDNTFRPNNTVTRAEMATFVSRLYDHIEEEDIDFEDGYERVEVVTGIISRIAADVKELTIGSTTFGTDENLVVKINDEVANFNDLKIGSEVRVVLKDEKITEINAYTTDEDVEKTKVVAGPISNIDLTNKKITVNSTTYGVADNASVEINGDTAVFSSLENKMEAVLVVLDDKIESIYAFEIQEEKDLEFTIETDSEESDDIEEAELTGDKITDVTPDLNDGELKIRLNGGSYKEIDLEEIDGSQNDGDEVAEELEAAIEDALNDVRVKVTFDEDDKRFIFKTYDSPTDEVPSIQFDGDDDVLDDIGLDDDIVKGSLDGEIETWSIITESDATKNQTFVIEIEVEDEDIDETITFSVDKGDTAEEIADEIADALLNNSDIRSVFGIKVDDEEVILTPDDGDDLDVDMEINEK